MQKLLLLALASPELFHRIRIWRKKLISKMLQNFQNHLMCTHIQNIYLVVLLFLLKSTCCLNITGHSCCRSVLGSKPRCNKMRIKRESSDKQMNKKRTTCRPHSLTFVSMCGIMTVLFNLMTLWQFGVILKSICGSGFCPDPLSSERHKGEFVTSAHSTLCHLF